MVPLKIFPAGITPEGEKYPLVKWKTEASSDPQTIKYWQDTFRDRIKLWGLPTGADNNIFALDIDVKNGVSGFETLKSMGLQQLPVTAFQHTPSGGMHLFFNYNELYSANTVDEELRLDTRSKDGFVWLYEPRFDIPKIDIPPWIDAIRAKSHKQLTLTSHEQAPMKLDPALAINKFNEAIQLIRECPPGGRNHMLNTQAYVVGQLVAGGAIDHNFAYEQLTQAALSIGLTPFETQHTISSGLKGGYANPVSHPFGDKPPVPAFKIPDLPALPEQTRWTPRFGTREELMDWSKLKKPQLFENWSSEDITLTSAVGGVGKTTLKLYEAVCLALGESFLGFRCLKPGRTLFIIGEDSEKKIYAMIGKICKQLGFYEKDKEHLIEAVLNNIVVKRADDLCLVELDPRTKTFKPNQDSLAKMYQAIDDLKPVQIIWDPIAMFWGPESGGNDMAMALAKCMQQIQIYSDASLDMISHIGKDSHSKKDLSQFSGRGGTALANHSRIVRTLMSIDDEEFLEETGEKLPDGQTAMVCLVGKFSDGSPLLGKPFIIVRNGYCFDKKDVVAKTANGLVNNEKERILQYIRTSTESRPITQSIVCDYFFIQNPKINKGTCKAVISMLVLEGLIEEISHGDETVGKWLRPKYVTAQ